MRNTVRGIFVALLVLLSASWVSSASAGLVYNSVNNNAYTQDALEFDYPSNTGTMHTATEISATVGDVAVSGPLTSAVPGGAFTNTLHAIYTDASISGVATQSRPDNGYRLATTQSTLFAEFIPSTWMTYTISGSWTTDANSYRYTYVDLRDVSPELDHSNYLYQFGNTASLAPGTFTLDDSYGPGFYGETLSLTGLLIPGHIYQASAQFVTQYYGNVDPEFPDNVSMPADRSSSTSPKQKPQQSFLNHPPSFSAR
ncbi:MAG: hypothetical protein K8T91_04330 [Planctomycetes bacterium]|nr:hypothetical protein [Planctomycetota bacterium]